MRVPCSEFGEIGLILLITLSCYADQTKFALEEDTPWRNILKFTKRHYTIFLDIYNNTNVRFVDSVLRSLHDDRQSITLLDELNVLQDPSRLDLKLRLMNSDKNLVFSTKFLHTNMLDNVLLKFILKSHCWSILFILVTTEDDFYRCDHGKLNNDALTNIEDFLNVLWHKHRMIHVFLTFPYVCPNNYIVYNDTKTTDRNLYNRTIKTINTDEEFLDALSRRVGRMLTRNYPLRGNIFYRFPTAIENCSGTDIYIKTVNETSGGFCGMDGLVMSDVVTHFEFNLSLPTLSRGYNKYGYEQADGTVTGILGHIVRKDIDISFNSRFVAKYTSGVQEYKYLHQVARDALCPIMRQPGVEPLWQYPVNSFTWTQWLFILMSLSAIGVFMWGHARIQNIIQSSKTSTLLCYIVTSVTAGLFGIFVNRRNDLLVFRVACLYASIIILATYQGYINHVFTTRFRYAAISSLADLAESRTVIQTSPSIYGLLNESYNEVTATIISRTLVLEDTDSFAYVLNHENTATLERQSDAIMLTWMQYTDGDGKPKLYVVNECLRDFYLSYIASTEFPFHNILRTFMIRLIETGLPDMYYSWTSRALGLEVTLPSMASEPRPAGKVAMGEQVIAFSVLLLGYALAVTVFVVELWWFRRQIYPFLP